jgi:hypothetical protein
MKAGGNQPLPGCPRLKKNRLSDHPSMARIAAVMSGSRAFGGRLKKEKNDGILSAPHLHPPAHLDRRRHLAIP